ncbi:MAG: MFS transporter, partial [Eubacteriales bacterium]|nr:MFS transporter [Eubacteriales bacterium]
LRNTILIMFMYMFFVRGIYSYLAVMISELGGGPLSLGYTYFLDAGPEIVTFFLASRLLARFEGRWLVLSALLLQVARLSLIFVFDNTISIMLLGILGGFSYGLIAAAYKTQIYELAPDRIKISCVSLSESIIGFAGLCSVPVFGFVTAEYGGRVSVAAALVLSLLTAAFVIKTQILKKHIKKTNTKKTRIPKRVRGVKIYDE